MKTNSAKPSGLNIKDLLRPHFKLLIVGLVAVIGEGVADLLQPWPLKIVLDNVLKSRDIHGWLNRFILSTVGQDKLAILRFAAFAVLAVAVVDAICTYTEKYVTTSVGQWVMHDLRRTLYHHIQRLSLAYHDRKQTGDLISRVTNDIDAIQTFISSGLLGVLVNCLTLFGMVGVMLYINWQFTLIALSIAPVLFAVVFSYTRRIKKASREVRKKEGEMVSVMQEVLSSIRVVKAFAREEYEERRLEEESLESVEIAMRARSLKAKLSPLVGLIVAGGTAMVLWFGARMALSGALSAGSLVVFIMYLGKMYKPMQELSKMTDTYSKASIGYERIQEVLNTDGEIKDLPGAKRAPRFKGNIELDHLNFGYEPDRPVLRDVSLKIEPGQVAALVGPTGAGKSTIISLIPRFYDPISGAVKIDGQDIRRFQQKSLRQQMSFVLQETLLFHGTIWYNIAYGKPEATRREILRAAEMANAQEFIEKLPEGYNTMVGERGVTLSGGQRQRIAIARAIVRNTPILILDEPSSGLDAASEKLVFEALERLMEGRTSIVIAHRLSTIRRANIIFVVKDGTIVESGNQEELLKAGGLYSELYKIQFSIEEEPEKQTAGLV
ncbi:MAG TPA: ABC transporter ATP-binding protein [Bryobacteraceae bacterium]|nr:ABC transporter ATP-binding protein [Bryobacteraceae bacterium]